MLRYSLQNSVGLNTLVGRVMTSNRNYGYRCCGIVYNLERSVRLNTLQAYLRPAVVNIFSATEEEKNLLFIYLLVDILMHELSTSIYAGKICHSRWVLRLFT